MRLIFLGKKVIRHSRAYYLAVFCNFHKITTRFQLKLWIVIHSVLCYICHSERDCHRSTTTQLWNADMSSSSNHTKAFVQCCHGKHTVASSRTLLSDHVGYEYTVFCKNDPFFEKKIMCYRYFTKVGITFYGYCLHGEDSFSRSRQFLVQPTPFLLSHFVEPKT